MKAAISALLGVSVLALAGSPADAGTRAKKQRYHVKQESQSQTTKRVKERGDYYEHIADKLPFGSSVWWEQMTRERRSGRSG